MKNKCQTTNQENDVAELLDFLRFPLGSADGILEKFGRLPGAVREGKNLKQFVFIEGWRPDKIVLVAHADTCMDMLYRADKETIPQNVQLADGIIKNPGQVLGADDRAGCAILWLLRDLGHSLLVVHGEEYGEIGSTYLMNHRCDIGNKINNEHQFAVQFDRKNGRDFKCYGVGTPEFRSYISIETGYTEPNRAASTDIVTLCRRICGVNLSVGYQFEHTDKEQLIVTDWLHTLNLSRRWLGQKSLPRFSLTEPDPDYKDTPDEPYKILRLKP